MSVPCVDELIIRIKQGPIECTRILNGQKIKKILSAQQVVTLMQQLDSHTLVEDELVDLEIPENCFRVVHLDSGTTLYGLYVPAHQSAYNYHGSVYPQTPFPPLVFFIKVSNGSLNDSAVVAVPCERHDLSAQTPVYFYPFGNVYQTTKLCWGSIPRPELNSTAIIGAIPRIFLAGEHNDHGFGLQSHGAQREILQRLQGKEFPFELLKPINGTLGQWWKSLNKR